MTHSVSIGVRSYAPPQSCHRHDYAQLIVPLAGRMEIEIAGRLECLGPHRAALVAPDSRHVFEATSEGRFLVVDIADVELLNSSSISNHLARPHVAFPLEPRVRRFAAYLAGELRCDPTGPIATSTSGAEMTLELLSAPTTNQARPVAPRLRDIWQKLQRDMARPYAIHDLAREAGLSVSQFNRRFRAAFGQSPKQTQIDARLQRAAYWLTSTDRRISTIAYAPGYANVSSFTNLFRHRYGMTPSAYRAQKIK